MNESMHHSLAPQRICRTLVQKKVITADQAKEILKKKDVVQKRLEEKQIKDQSDSFGVKITNPVTIIDVIASFNMKRSDGVPGYLDEESLFYFLSGEWNVPYRKIDPLKLDLNLVTTTIPRSFAMKHLVLPIDVSDGVLTIATSDPFNKVVIDDIVRVAQMPVKVVLSSKSDIIKLINEFFGFKRSIAAAEVQFNGPLIDLGNLEQLVRLKSAEELPSNDQHIVSAVNHLFNYAIDQRASDIHIEPKRDVSMIRLRIDGVLHTVYNLPKKVHLAIVSRIKALSRLDISEKRRPQDGRIKTGKAEQEIEMRISTVPVAFGEKVVIRIMDPEILFQDLHEIGFTKADYERYQKFIKMPHGIVMVCGPTGSGKSTTLYSTLRKLASPEINITTVEDPIEMIHEQFNQIAVQPAVGITFANILRNILRQDPDIIMIGEMRDLDTAENAIQAALTGHLVLSTLHTNDAPSAITRLIDLGVQPFLLQATLVGILSQRLVRGICEYCSESFFMDASELETMALDTGREGRVKLCRGLGCIRCRGTGYFGRSGIFEVLPVTEKIKEQITPEANLDEIRRTAVREGMKTLRENAIAKLLDGETTYEEVLRVTWEGS